MHRSHASLTRNSTIVLLALAILGILALLVSKSVSRWLRVGDFGIQSIVVRLQGLITLSFVFDMNAALPKFVSEHRSKTPDISPIAAKEDLLIVPATTFSVRVLHIALADIIGNGLYDE